jgi:hypothetical protein
MDMTVTTKTRGVEEVPPIPADVAADLTALAPTKRGQQVNVDFATKTDVKIFIAQSKGWADENGFVFRRIAPTANLKISDMPLRVTFQLVTVKDEESESVKDEESE